MLELLPSFEPQRRNTDGPHLVLKARPEAGKQFVSQDRRRTTDATNHLAATPDTQSGRSGAALTSRRLRDGAFRRWRTSSTLVLGSSQPSRAQRVPLLPRRRSTRKLGSGCPGAKGAQSRQASAQMPPPEAAPRI